MAIVLSFFLLMVTLVLIVQDKIIGVGLIEILSRYSEHEKII